MSSSCCRQQQPLQPEPPLHMNGSGCGAGSGEGVGAGPCGRAAGEDGDDSGGGSELLDGHRGGPGTAGRRGEAGLRVGGEGGAGEGGGVPRAWPAPPFAPV